MKCQECAKEFVDRFALMAHIRLTHPAIYAVIQMKMPSLIKMNTREHIKEVEKP